MEWFGSKNLQLLKATKRSLATMLNQNFRMTEIITPNEFGTITEKKIIDFQEIIGFELPDDYFNFLKLYNGGKTKFDSLKIYNRKKEELWSFGYLFGIHNKEYWASIFWAMKSLENRIPNEFLPIADNNGGDYYVMNLSKEKFRQIFIWNHNNESVKNGTKYYKNLTFLFNSFSELLQNLTIDNKKIDITITETDDDFIIS